MEQYQPTNNRGPCHQLKPSKHKSVKPADPSTCQCNAVYSWPRTVTAACNASIHYIYLSTFTSTLAYVADEGCSSTFWPQQQCQHNRPTALFILYNTPGRTGQEIERMILHPSFLTFTTSSRMCPNYPTCMSCTPNPLLVSLWHRLEVGVWQNPSQVPPDL